MDEDKAHVLAETCIALSSRQLRDAAEILSNRYPFVPLTNLGRRYSPRQLMPVFVRDGFVDRYTGKLLVFPGTLRLISRLLPEQFPFHPNWKTDVCHFAFYELFPTLDHVVPVSRGGLDSIENWVTASMLTNAAKGNFTLDELGWTLRLHGTLGDWDGLTKWFLEWTAEKPEALTDA